MEKDYSILVGGAAGQGSRKAGLLIAKLLNAYGYKIFIYDDYESLIKGGHNFSQIRATEKKVLSHRKKIDFLLALNQETIKKHKEKLSEKGLIIYSSGKIETGENEGIGINIEKITKDEGGIPIMENVALVAGFAKIIGIEWQTVEKIIKREFSKKTEINLKIAKRSYEESKSSIEIEKIESLPSSLLTGNEAVALGAVKAGLDFYSAYPMTPASNILHYLATHKKDFNIAVAHLENEIGAVGAALGAAYAGAKSMTATSGGGFALMTEFLSMSAQSEIPLLIVESQRPGPASGVPTYTTQADLLFVMSAGHGDFSRFIIAPGDAEETFLLAGLALNLSWKYQTPSILLIDKEISESTFSFDKDIENKVEAEKPLLFEKEKEYKRYKDTENGISPLTFPGKKNVVVKTSSYEHDEYGITAEEDEKMIKKMQDKRLKKFKAMEEEVERIEAVKVYGDKNSKKAIIVWGSTKGPAKEACEKMGIKMIQPLFFQPFPENQIKKALSGVEKLISIETNATGQMEKILKGFGIKVDNRILKYTGRPFLPEEIEEKLRKII